MNNFLYYSKSFIYNSLPLRFFEWNYRRLKRAESHIDKAQISARLNYYFKVNNSFKLPEHIETINNYKRQKGTGYYLDLKEFLHYFKSDTKFAYHFGDETHVNLYPTLFKARPILGDNKNSILFKLNKYRHFRWVNDPNTFEDKNNKLVWRGGAYHGLRKTFVENYWNHPLCNVGQTNKPIENKPWQKSFMTIGNQLKYKFIFCPEGNDVATNLKWVMSSNSLCFMPKPKFETWFMEGALKPGVHYVEINDNFENLEEKIRYYTMHRAEALEIIKNANEYVRQFQNKDLEDLLCFKVLERYVNLSSQDSALLFEP